MKPWFIREDNVVPFPKKDKGVVRLPNVNAYPDFLTGVQDLQNHLKNGDISPDIHKKLYQDLIQRFMKVESFETPWFIREAPGDPGITGLGVSQQPAITPNQGGISNFADPEKIKNVQSMLAKGNVTDKDLDFIVKILNKPELKKTINTLIAQVPDKDVERFTKISDNNIKTLASTIRKIPVDKQSLETFLQNWSKGTSFVDTSKLKNGSAGTFENLIPDATAREVFRALENIRPNVSVPKKGTIGYGEFGLAMLSPNVEMVAPGDIRINGQPVEVKASGGRLYSDERGVAGQKESIEEASAQSKKTSQVSNQTKKEPEILKTRAKEMGNITNVIKNINDPEVKKGLIDTLTSLKDSKAQQFVNSLKPDQNSLDLLKKYFWTVSFNWYKSINKNMPILLMSGNKWFLSNNAEDFIKWGCLPKTDSEYGYLLRSGKYGRVAGQSKEVYPKIIIPQ